MLALFHGVCYSLVLVEVAEVQARSFLNSIAVLIAFFETSSEAISARAGLPLEMGASLPAGDRSQRHALSPSAPLGVRSPLGIQADVGSSRFAVGALYPYGFHHPVSSAHLTHAAQSLTPASSLPRGERLDRGRQEDGVLSPSSGPDRWRHQGSAASKLGEPPCFSSGTQYRRLLKARKPRMNTRQKPNRRAVVTNTPNTFWPDCRLTFWLICFCSSSSAFSNA